MSATAPALIKSGLPSTVLMDIEATAIVAAYQSLTKHGIEFGRLCYNFRKRSEVVSGGTTFTSTLDRLNIPHATAYRWIARYEESIGKRVLEPAVKKPVQSVQVVPPASLASQVQALSAERKAELLTELQQKGLFLDVEEPQVPQETDIFAEALALPDAPPLAPKQEYPKSERGIGLLQELAQSISAQYKGECKVTGTSGSDNLPVTTGRYNITLNLKGVSMQRVTNALKALKESE
jgi:hypothetical protein